MFDPERLLGQMIGGALGGGGKRRDRERSRGGFGSMLGGAGKMQAGLGLLGIAMAAYEHYQQKPGAPSGTQPPAAGPTATYGASIPPPPPVQQTATGAVPPPPPGSDARIPPLPTPAGARMTLPPPPAHAPPDRPTIAAPAMNARQQEAALLIRAMIAAAAADGDIDRDERDAIIDRARAAGDDADTLAWLAAELRSPLTVEQLIAQTPASLAEQVYAASLIGISVDTDEELQHLDRLADGFGIGHARREELHQQLGLA